MKWLWLIGCLLINTAYATRIQDAEIAYRNQDYKAAARLFNALATEDKHNPDWHYDAGNALALQQQYQAAIAAYDKALALAPDHEDARYNRGIIAELLKQQEEQQGQQQDQQQDQNTHQNNQKDEHNQQQTNQQDEASNHPQTAANTPPEAREKQEFNDRMLKVIPDDPGGLLREKFLRDHLKRHGDDL